MNKIDVRIKLISIVLITVFSSLFMIDYVPEPWNKFSVFVSFIGGLLYMENVK